MADLKNRERLGTSTDRILTEDLRELSEQSRIPISRLVDEAIELLLKKHKFVRARPEG